jgi:hypothetical protein
VRVRRHFIGFAVAAALLLVFAGSCSRRAEQKAVKQRLAQMTPAERAEVTLARQMFQQANDLFGEKNYPPACALYKSAWDLHPNYRIAANLGNCEYTRKNYQGAAVALTNSMRTQSKDIPAEESQRVAQLYEATMKHLATLQVRIQEAGAADIFIGDTHIGHVPTQHEFVIAPGRHLVHARNGSASSHTWIEVKEGDTQAISLTLVTPEKIVDATPDPPSYAHAFVGTGLGLATALFASGFALNRVANALQAQQSTITPEVAQTAEVSQYFLMAGCGAGLIAIPSIYMIMPEPSIKTQRVIASIEPRRDGFTATFRMTF